LVERYGDVVAVDGLDVERFRTEGGTVVLTTHQHMEEAARRCDRVAIVDRGRIVDEDTPAALVAPLGADPIARALEGRVAACGPLSRVTSDDARRGCTTSQEVPTHRNVSVARDCIHP
jgi:ABC-type multidrug transport system ATPase subunit